MRTMAARHFGALKNAIRSLEQCYSENLPNTEIPPGPRLEFPYPLSYTCINTSSTRDFTYKSQMDNSKLLFAAAETPDNEMICIKFVRHYSKDVHVFCASKGFAKGFALTLKGFRELPGWMAYGTVPFRPTLRPL